MCEHSFWHCNNFGISHKRSILISYLLWCQMRLKMLIFNWWNPTVILTQPPFVLAYVCPIKNGTNTAENTYLLCKGLPSCSICFNSAALFVLNELQVYLFTQIQSSKTGGQLYSDTYPYEIGNTKNHFLSHDLKQDFWWDNSSTHFLLGGHTRDTIRLNGASNQNLTIVYQWHCEIVHQKGLQHWSQFTTHWAAIFCQIFLHRLLARGAGSEIKLSPALGKL